MNRREGRGLSPTAYLDGRESPYPSFHRCCPCGQAGEVFTDSWWCNYHAFAEGGFR
jgi:hypothetical protein